MIKRLLPLFLLFAFHFSSAQFYFRPGYNIGLCNPKEINKVIYIHNQLNSGYYATGKKMHEVKTFGGIAVAIGSEWDENSGWELQWQNKHSIVRSQFEYQGQTIVRDLKIRTNMLNYGMYYGNKHLSGGASLDFGNFKGFYKRAPKDSIKSAKYAYVFQALQPAPGVVSDVKEKNMLLTLQMGLTLYGQVTMGPLGARLFYQFQFMNMDIDNLDYKLLGAKVQADNDLEDHFNNVGLLLFLKIGGYHD